MTSTSGAREEEDNREDGDAALNAIVAAALDGGLQALTPVQREWLETWLWENGHEEFEGHSWDHLEYPKYDAERLWLLEGVVDPERLDQLEGGALLSKEEQALFRDAWRRRMERDPDDDFVPGLWTARVEASDGTAVKTTRLCRSSGWQTERTLWRVEPTTPGLASEQEPQRRRGAA